jgi:hypothetical protein
MVARPHGRTPYGGALLDDIGIPPSQIALTWTFPMLR